MDHFDDLTTIARARRLPNLQARRALRLAAGLRLKDVADALGVAPQTVYRWEHGLREPHLKNRERYAHILNLCRQVGDE